MRCRLVEQAAGRGGNGEILAVGGAGETGAGIAEEWPGDDAADAQRIADFSRNPAKVIQTLQSERALMRGDLQDAVG